MLPIHYRRVLDIWVEECIIEGAIKFFSVGGALEGYRLPITYEFPSLSHRSRSALNLLA